MALIGADFAAYVAPTQAEIDAQAAAAVREKRDNLLVTEVDHIAGNALRWADLAADKQNEWTQYRTDLLNIPQQNGFPYNIVWPIKPE